MSNPLNAKQRSHIKHLLQVQHQALQAQLHQSLEQSQSHAHAYNELSHLDNHIADQATELYDLERDASLHDHLISQLEQTEAALEKINTEDFGYCKVCHEAIPFERLESVPETQYCIQHHPLTSTSDQYELLDDHFYTKNNDEQDAVYFDGEDTTQALFQYGTSSISEYQNYNYEFSDEFDDSFQNGVEALEDFVATDITGHNVYIVRNQAYKQYLNEQQLELDDQI